MAHVGICQSQPFSTGICNTMLGSVLQVFARKDPSAKLAGVGFLGCFSANGKSWC